MRLLLHHKNGNSRGVGCGSLWGPGGQAVIEIQRALFSPLLQTLSLRSKNEDFAIFPQHVSPVTFPILPMQILEIFSS